MQPRRPDVYIELALIALRKVPAFLHKVATTDASELLQTLEGLLKEIPEG